MKTPEQLAERREKMRLYMANRRKDPVQAALNRERVKKWQRANPEKAKESSRAWRAANPERVKELNNRWRLQHTPEELSAKDRYDYRRNKRATHLLRTFDLTVEQYEAMVIAQGGHCALCPKPDRPEKRLAVDHNHTTGKVRALLCDCCNRGIGLFNDEAARLRAAADYLEAHDLTGDEILA